MTHMVEVKQIRDRTDGAFLNVLCELGSVGVQAHIYKCPTYIVISESGSYVDFVRYANWRWAEEGLEDYANRDGNWRVIPVSDLIDAAKLATTAAAVTDAAKARDEAERELREALAELAQAKKAIVELADYLKRVADYRHVDVNELEAFVAKVKEMHGDGSTIPPERWKASAEGLFSGYLDAANELSAVREALGAYDDSDLASLAETLVKQQRMLARWTLIAFDEGRVTPGAVTLARAILEEAESDH